MVRVSLILGLVFVDMLAVGMVVPLIPYIADQLGAGAALYGLLVSLYGALQIIGGPIIGFLSDIYPRTFLLSLSFFSAAISYSLMGSASSLFLLFFSRVPVGICKQTVTLSQALISDATSEEERNASLGNLAAAVETGFALGPSLGSLFLFLPLISSFSGTEEDYRYPCFVAAFIYLLEMLILWMVEGRRGRRGKEGKEKEKEEEEEEGICELSQTRSWGMSRYLRLPLMSSMSTMFSSILAYYFLYLFSQMIFTLYTPKFIQTQYNANAAMNGYLLSYLSLLSAFFQSIGLGLVSPLIKESRLIPLSSFFLTLSLLAITLAPRDVPSFMITLLPFSLSNAILGTSLVTQVTKIDEENVGLVLGLASVLEAIARTLSPLVSGAVASILGMEFVPLCSATGMMLFTVCYLSTKQHLQP